MLLSNNTLYKSQKATKKNLYLPAERSKFDNNNKNEKLNQIIYDNSLINVCKYRIYSNLSYC